MIKNPLLILLTTALLLSGMNITAEPKRPTKCAKKVLLPGQKKPMKCRKARVKKNAYF
jgi:hypothetical protein